MKKLTANNKSVYAEIKECKRSIKANKERMEMFKRYYSVDKNNAYLRIIKACESCIELDKNHIKLLTKNYLSNNIKK